MERLIDFADGRTRWMNVRYTPRRDAAGKVIGYYATTSDIHEQKTVEEELRRANSILSAHFENTPLAVIECDPALRVVRWSGNAETIFGWSADEALGRALGTGAWSTRTTSRRSTRCSGGWSHGPDSQATHLNRNYRKDGSVIWVEWHNSALRDERRAASCRSSRSPRTSPRASRPRSACSTWPPTTASRGCPTGSS